MPDELVYQGEFRVGDRVRVTADDVDGSWEGAEGVVVKTYRQRGGTFAAERDVTVAVPDEDNPDGESPEALAKLAKEYEEGDGFFWTSDEYEFEHA